MSRSLPHIPTAPGWLPVVGHALQLRRDATAFLSTLGNYGDLVQIHLGPRPAVVVTTPALVHQVLVGDARSVHKGRLFDKAKPFLGNGVLLSSGPTHIRQRRVVQPAFHRKRIDGYARVMAKEAAATARGLGAGEIVDIRDVMYDLVITILGKTLVATELGGWATREAQQAMPIIQATVARRTVSPFPFLERLPTPGNRRFDHAVGRLDHVLDRIIENYQQDDTDRGDLLSMLVSARDADSGEPLPADQIRDQVMNIVSAGMETSSDTLSWLWFELGRHPDIEARVHEEADRVLGARTVMVDDLPQLPFLHAVIKEVLRLHPPLTLLMRRTVAPLRLNGIELPTGTEIVICPALHHSDPAMFCDPGRFFPERWQRPETEYLPSGAYIPFGAGNRRCIGDAFAMTEIAVVVATMIRRWRLVPQPGHVLRPVQAVTVSPGRLPMVPEPRTGDDQYRQASSPCDTAGRRD